MIQRILGGLNAGIAGASGIGTGFAAGGVGKMNASWTGAALPTGHMVVSATGSSMVLTVAPGWALVQRDQGTSSFDPRGVMVELDASVTATVTANATGGVRNDTVCLKVDMASAPTSDGSNLVSVVILAGAAGGGLANAPADGNLYLPLANVAVANAAVSIAQGNVTDKRIWAPSDVCPFHAGIYLTGAQSIPNNTVTIVAFDTKADDPNVNAVTGAAAGYYIPAPGRYMVSARCDLAGSGAYLEQCRITRNAVEEIRGTDGQQQPMLQAHGQIRCTAAGDLIQFVVYQNSGGAMNTLTGRSLVSMEISYMGPL